MAKTTTAGIAALVADEGEVLNAYRDVVGVWTIGVGLTAASGLITPKAGMKITRGESRRLLGLALEKKYEPSVLAMLPDAKPHEFDGAVSFHWNTGAIRKASWVKLFAAGSKEKAKAPFLSWDKTGGKVIRGLTLRRQREWILISQGIYPHGIKPDTVIPDAPAPTVIEEPTKILRVGSKGEQVVDLQRRLQGLKLYAGSLDGSFGMKTEAAVKAFQTSHKLLVADGIAGPATIATLTRMSDATKKTVVYSATTAGATAVGVGTLPAWGGIAIAVASVASIGFIAWRYRDELKALIRLKSNA